MYTKAKRSEQWVAKCFTKEVSSEFLNVLPVKGHVLTQSVIVENDPSWKFKTKENSAFKRSPRGWEVSKRVLGGNKVEYE